MDLKYLGHSAFKIVSNGENKVNIVVDPFDPKVVGLPWKKQSADILLVSHAHKDHSFREGIEGDPFVIDCAGDYEVKGIHVYGVPSFHDESSGKDRGANIMYLVDTQERIKIAHLGDLGHALNPDQISELEDTDILLIPVGGTYTIDAKRAVEIINQIQPYVVVPMHYRVSGLNGDLSSKLSPLSDFLKAIEMEPKIVDKISFKSREDLPEEIELYTFSEA